MSRRFARTSQAMVHTPADASDTKGSPAESWVQKTPGVCGGDACIRNTRITVWGLASFRRLGLSDEEIRRRVPGLTQADLDAAWDYRRRHAEEIEQAICENEEDADED